MTKVKQYKKLQFILSKLLQWNLVCDLDYVSDLVNTVQGVGLLVGAGLFGQLSDLLGRKLGFFLANLLLCIGGRHA